MHLIEQTYLMLCLQGKALTPEHRPCIPSGPHLKVTQGNQGACQMPHCACEQDIGPHARKPFLQTGALWQIAGMADNSHLHHHSNPSDFPAAVCFSRAFPKSEEKALPMRLPCPVGL